MARDKMGGGATMDHIADNPRAYTELPRNCRLRFPNPFQAVIDLERVQVVGDILNNR